MREQPAWAPYVDRSKEGVVWLERIAAGGARPRSAIEARLALRESTRMIRNDRLQARVIAAISLVLGLASYITDGMGILSAGSSDLIHFLYPVGIGGGPAIGTLLHMRRVERNIPKLKRLASERPHTPS